MYRVGSWVQLDLHITTLSINYHNYYNMVRWSLGNVPVNSKITHPPPPSPTRANPGAFDFLKNFGQIPRHVASLDGQMPHPLELQRGSNPPPSRETESLTFGNKQNRLPLETSSAKFSATTNFLTVQLVFAPCLKQRHFPRYNYIKWQQQKIPREINKSNDHWTWLTCWLKELRNPFVSARW